MNDPRVYVVLLNYNAWPDTLDCIETLFRQSYRNFQILLVDNASSDGSVDKFLDWATHRTPHPSPADGRYARLYQPAPQYPRACELLTRQQAQAGQAASGESLLVIQAGENGGFAAGNNIAMRFAEARGDADFVWLVNNDTLVDPDALGELVRTCQATPAMGACGSTILHYSRPDVIQMIGGGRLVKCKGMTYHCHENRPASTADEARVDIDYICGASLMVRATALKGIGLLDESFFLYGEDLEWGLRARRAGWLLGVSRHSRIWHKGGATTKLKSPRQDYYVVRCTLQVMRMHHPVLLAIAMPYMLCRWLIPKMLRRQGNRLLAVVRAVRDGMLGRYGPSPKYESQRAQP